MQDNSSSNSKYKEIQKIFVSFVNKRNTYLQKNPQSTNQYVSGFGGKPLLVVVYYVTMCEIMVSSNHHSYHFYRDDVFMKC